MECVVKEEQSSPIMREISHWQRNSNIAALTGGVVLLGGALTANHPVVAVGLAVMATARIGGEWIVETLKKNVVAQHKDMVHNVGDASSIKLMIEAEKSQSIRPKVRTAMSSAYIIVGGATLFTPLLTSHPTDGMFVASTFVGAVAGFTAAHLVEKLARKKFRFYDNAPGVAAAVADAVLKNKIIEKPAENQTTTAPKSKI